MGHICGGRGACGSGEDLQKDNFVWWCFLKLWLPKHLQLAHAGAASKVSPEDLLPLPFLAKADQEGILVNAAFSTKCKPGPCCGCAGRRAEQRGREQQSLFLLVAGNVLTKQKSVFHKSLLGLVFEKHFHSN